MRMYATHTCVHIHSSFIKSIVEIEINQLLCRFLPLVFRQVGYRPHLSV